MTRSPQHRTLVYVDKTHDDTITTESGITFYVDPSFRPTHHVRCYGMAVITTPSGKDMPPIHEGDTVYFHYLSVNPDRLVADKTYSVDNEMVFCIQRRTGDLIMCNDYVLVQPVPKTPPITDNGKILAIPLPPTYMDSNLLHANPKTPVPPGTRVIYKPSCADLYTIAGNKYYVMRNSDLLAETDQP